MLLVILMHAALAVIFPIGRVVAAHAGPVFFTGIRMIIAGAILLGIGYPYAPLVGSFKKMKQKEFLLLGVLALFGMYLTNVPEFWALQYVPAAKASLLYMLSPFYAAIISYFWFHEKLTARKILGMAIGLAGFILLVSKDAPAETGGDGLGIFSWGELALVVAAISTSLGWVALRQLIRVYDHSSLVSNGLTMIVAGVVALLTSPFLGEVWAPVPVRSVVPFGISLVLAILFSNIIGYGLYGILLKKYSVTLLSFAGFTEVVFSAFYAWLFLGELLTWHFFASVLCIFCGLTIFYLDEMRQMRASMQPVEVELDLVADEIDNSG